MPVDIRDSPSQEANSDRVLIADLLCLRVQVLELSLIPTGEDSLPLGSLLNPKPICTPTYQKVFRKLTGFSLAPDVRASSP